jgi:FkbM family methyltransferase
MRKFLQKLARSRVGPKLSVAAWWTWRTMGFHRPGALSGRVAVGRRHGRLEWQQTGELLQAMSIFAPANAWNHWEPSGAIRTILDVGANIGQTATYWRLRFPAARIGAVEMMPDNVARIERQASLNGWNFRILQVAATDMAGTVPVRLSDANSRNRLEIIVETSAVRDKLQDKTINVPALPLAAIMDRLGFAAVDLMKVDIEGAEVNLLRDLPNWAPRVRTLIMEIHDNVDAAWARRALEQAGYEISPLESDGNPEWLCTQRELTPAEKATRK